MIARRYVHPIRGLRYVIEEIIISLLSSTLVFLLAYVGHYSEVALPATVLSVVATALSFFIGFKSNAAYSRWWDARSQWASIMTGSRVVARLVVTLADGKAHMPTYDAARAEAFKKRMLYRIVAWVIVMRNTLRLGGGLPTNPAPTEAVVTAVEQYILDKAEWEALRASTNPAVCISLYMGKDLYRAMGDGTLVGFDSFQIEVNLLSIMTAFTSCEKIKMTPIPTPYTAFTRVFVIVLTVLFPFCTIASYVATNNEYLVIPVSLIVCIAFAFADKSAMLIEHPFAMHINDIPLNALTIEIERDVRLILGEPKEMYPAPLPVDAKGYLW